MGFDMPSMTIAFIEKGITAIQRSQRGIIAMIVEEDDISSLEASPYIVYSITDIPEALSEENAEQVKLALKGYQKSPRRILLYVIKSVAEEDPDASKKYNSVLVSLENQRWDYLVIPNITPSESEDIASWVKSMRTQKDIMVKAVLPNTKADHEGVVNFTNEKIVTQSKEYATRDYCSRIAGIITGTPMTISCTYAPLPEVIEVDEYTSDQRDEKVGKGELFVFNDGERIKISRGVNSFVTWIQGKNRQFSKIKLVDLMDMIHDDIKQTAEEYYIGKYANSYDNKYLLIGAIKGYFDKLELDGLLEKGQNSVYLDLPQTKAWALSNGRATQEELEAMSEQRLKEFNTMDEVFLAAELSMLDAMEKMYLRISI